MSADIFEAFGNASNVKRKFQNTLQPRTGIPFSSVEVPLDDKDKNGVGPKRKSHENTEDDLWRSDGNGNDILFDAFFEDDQDDFGEFQDVEGHESSHYHSGGDLLQSKVASKGVGETIPNDENLLDLVSDRIPPTSTRGATTAQSFTLKPYLDQAATRDLHGVNSDLLDDAWGDFERIDDTDLSKELATRDAGSAQSLNPVETSEIEAENDIWKPFDETDGQFTTERLDQNPSNSHIVQGNDIKYKPQRPQTQSGVGNSLAERPTNVPPPAILLEILPAIFTQLSNKTTSPEEELREIGHNILMVHLVATRIIAGRPLRWKRDTILTQSTRIGQAGKAGGMKLTAVNKSEVMREDREVAEAISHWSEYANKFNVLLSKIKMHHPRMTLSSSSIPIKALNNSSTLLQDSHPCPVCGLKRNERLQGVDTDAEDSFGGFWVTHWGHKDCQEFWIRYQELLGHR